MNQEASNRATAMQVRMDTERASAESEFHRRQAEAEAARILNTKEELAAKK